MIKTDRASVERLARVAPFSSAEMLLALLAERDSLKTENAELYKRNVEVRNAHTIAFDKQSAAQAERDAILAKLTGRP